MDQVRAIVRVLWTQRFWVLSVICTIVAVVCWNMAAGSLQAEFSKRKSAIDGAYSSVNTIKGEVVHPNDDVNEGDMNQAKQQKQYVLKVWQELYDRQRTEVLNWPEELGEEFVEKMRGRKFRDSISSTMRGIYHEYIETQFEPLLEIVKAQKAEAGRRGGFAGGEFGGGEFGAGEFGGGYAATRGAVGSETEDDDYLVLWLDQGSLQQKLLFKTKPTATQVWVTQEDLWVYETLLHVIAKTNEARGATRPDNTAVRAIVNLQVGQAASKASTAKVYIPEAPAGGGGEFGGYSEFGGGEFGGGYSEFGGGEFGGGYSEFGGGEFGGEYGRGGGTESASDEALLSNRYLDAEGKPDPGSGETVGSAEFRQLPIRMTLMMDQRWIPRVLIECANATLPVEVKQVRVNPKKSGAGFGRSSQTVDRGLQGLAPDANLAEVEIRGAVYIYNEPDREQLAIPGDEDEPLADVALNN